MAEKFWTEEEVIALTNEKFGGNREKAEFWIIDHDGWLPDENKEEIKASIKEATKGAKSTENTPKKSKPKAKDEEKVAFIAELATLLNDNGYECDIANPQKEIKFYIGENFYSISLTKHGKKYKG